MSHSGVRLLILLHLIAATVLSCPSPTRAQTATVTINGEPITEDEIDQRSRLDFLSTHKQSDRQDVINELSDDRDNIREAEKSGLNLGSDEVDRFYAQMCARMRITPEQMAKSLEGNGVRVHTLKRRIKADAARTSLARLHYRKSG